MKKKLVSVVVASFFATNAHAFGVNDLATIGIQVGTQVIGAGVDKVKESMRDPEAEAREQAEQERKLAEAFQMQVNEIEAAPGLRPIDRERLIRSLIKQQEWVRQMQTLAEQAHARQKAERDKIFTTSGFLSVVGEAALGTPSAVLARTDLMMNNPVWRAEQKAQNEAVLAKADAMVATGIPQAQARAVLAQADMVQASGVNEAGTKAVVNTADAMRETQVTKQDIETVAVAVADAGAKEDTLHGMTAPSDAQQALDKSADAHAAFAQASSKNAFMPDLGRKIYVEFVGSPSETQFLKNRLQAMGHTLVESREEAEVVYLVEGEYYIPGTKRYEGVTMSLGELLESPEKAIPEPSKKLSGGLAAGVSKLMMLAAAGQGQNIPAGAAPKEGVYQQETLLVIARQPKDGKETRFSVVKSAESADLLGAKLAAQTRDDIYAALGLSEARASSEQDSAEVQQAKEGV